FWAEKLPETEDEAREVGDGRWSATLHLQEVRPPKPLDRQIVELFPESWGVSSAIAQFNVARRARTPVDRFLGMYKVLETQFHNDPDAGARRAFRAAPRLRDAIAKIVGVTREGVKQVTGDQDI